MLEAYKEELKQNDEILASNRIKRFLNTSEETDLLQRQVDLRVALFLPTDNFYN